LILAPIESAYATSH